MLQTRVKAACFCQKFRLKIVGAAYNYTITFRGGKLACKGSQSCHQSQCCWLFHETCSLSWHKKLQHVKLQDNSGKISLDELREVSIQFGLPIEPELLEIMFARCDVDGDGQINYDEFANFLNWKDKMPSGGIKCTLTGKQKDESAEVEAKVAMSVLGFNFSLKIYDTVTKKHLFMLVPPCATT